MKEKTELLELVHSYLTEFKGILTWEENRYIIAFIDNFLNILLCIWLKIKVIYLKFLKLQTLYMPQGFWYKLQNLLNYINRYLDMIWYVC